VVGGARQGWYPRLEQEVKEAGVGVGVGSSCSGGSPFHRVRQ
jgi:hypothetical protein